MFSFDGTFIQITIFLSASQVDGSLSCTKPFSVSSISLILIRENEKSDAKIPFSNFYSSIDDEIPFMVSFTTNYITFSLTTRD